MRVFKRILILFFILGCTNSKELQLDKDKKAVAREIIENAKNCSLITVDSMGIADARAMDPFLPDENFVIWMGTNSRSAKVSQIKINPNVTLYYFDRENVGYVTLQGVAEIVNSEAEKQQFWKKEWENFYKNRTTDYSLIKFTPRKAKVISEKYNILGDKITWEVPEMKF